MNLVKLKTMTIIIFDALALAVLLFALAGKSALGQTVEPAKGPTTDQARDFISSMVEQHSNSTCEIKHADPEFAKWNHETQENGWLAKIEGNRILIQQTSRSKTDASPHKVTHTSVSTMVIVTSGLLSELSADAKTVVDHPPNDCGIAYVVELKCKATACLKRKTSLTFSGEDMFGERLSGETTVESGIRTSISIPIADAAIAGRIWKAIQFYQEHSPAAAPSPF